MPMQTSYPYYAPNLTSKKRVTVWPLKALIVDPLFDVLANSI